MLLFVNCQINCLFISVTKQFVFIGKQYDIIVYHVKYIKYFNFVILKYN